MGHTNSTANLGLPQFIGTDKPTWLGDINSAFAAVDAYAGTNDAAVAGAVADAGSAISQASAAVNTANTANTTAGNASTAANNAVGVANTANAIAGAVDAKVGLLADLNTTDRTSIVNAINEAITFGVYELWTNANVSQPFAAQSVIVTGDFDTFIVEYGNAYSSEGVNFIESEESGALNIATLANGHYIYMTRRVSITKAGTTNTIAFADNSAYELITYGTQPTPTIANAEAIPYRIFGIKHNS